MGKMHFRFTPKEQLLGLGSLRPFELPLNSRRLDGYNPCRAGVAKRQTRRTQNGGSARARGFNSATGTTPYRRTHARLWVSECQAEQK